MTKTTNKTAKAIKTKVVSKKTKATSKAKVVPNTSTVPVNMSADLSFDDKADTVYDEYDESTAIINVASLIPKAKPGWLVKDVTVVGEVIVTYEPQPEWVAPVVSEAMSVFIKKMCDWVGTKDRDIIAVSATEAHVVDDRDKEVMQIVDKADGTFDVIFVTDLPVDCDGCHHKPTAPVIEVGKFGQPLSVLMTKAQRKAMPATGGVRHPNMIAGCRFAIVRKHEELLWEEFHSDGQDVEIATCCVAPGSSDRPLHCPWPQCNKLFCTERLHYTSIYPLE
jgi:hypothetical protein